jgi:aryl-alcohol dehydrogenase-like predicted oxidoreductase
MERRRCGSSSIELSPLGIGCWSFGGGDYWGPQQDGAEREVVAAALDHGVVYFDTAPQYNDGQSEEALGRALRGRRHRAVIGTKVAPEHCVSPESLRRACEGSLRRLGTETIDLYMVHWPITGRPVAEAFETLMSLRGEGKIREIGVSNHGVQQMTQALGCGASIQCNQLCYNLLCRAIEREILPFCERKGIGVLSYMPLMQGLLTARYRSPDEVPVSFARTRHFGGSRPGARHGEPGAEPETFAAIQAIRELAVAAGMLPQVLSLKWVRARPELTTVLLGVRTVAQLKEDLSAFDGGLPPAMMEKLDALTRPLMDRLGPSPDYYEASTLSRIR